MSLIIKQMQLSFAGQMKYPFQNEFVINNSQVISVFFPDLKPKKIPKSGQKVLLFSKGMSLTFY